MNDDNADTFEVHGHEVAMLSPLVARVTIKCPFGRIQAANLEQQSFVMNQTQSVVNYMLKEGFLSPDGAINIMVLTSHP